MSEYILAKDILIPAGTKLYRAPSQTIRCDADGNPATASGKPAEFVEAIIGPTKDTTYSWTMHIGDALDAGLIRPTTTAEGD